MPERLESRLSPAVIATWTDASGVDNSWTRGTNWDTGVAPTQVGDWAILVGFNSGSGIPGPTISTGTPPIVLSKLTTANGVGTSFAADTLTIGNGTTLTIDKDPGTNLGGAVNWQAGTMSLAASTVAVSILNGTQATFTAGAITGNSSSVGNLYVRGVDANNNPANITFGGSFSQLGVNLILGDPVTGGTSTAEVKGDLSGSINLSNGAVITLNGKTKLTLDSPTGTNDVGLSALNTSSTVSGTSGFVVTVGTAGTGANTIFSPAVIGGAGVVACNWTNIKFAQDANGNSITLTSDSNNTGKYQQAANTGVVCDGKVTVTSGVAYFSSGNSSTTTTLKTPLFTVTGSGSTLQVGDKQSANYIGLYVTGDMKISSATFMIATSGGVGGPYGDQVVVNGNVTYSDVVLQVWALTPWGANKSWQFLQGTNITTGGNNTIDKKGTWQPPVFNIRPVQNGGNTVALSLDDF
jgi:hypothetical protein